MPRRTGGSVEVAAEIAVAVGRPRDPPGPQSLGSRHFRCCSRCRSRAGRNRHSPAAHGAVVENDVDVGRAEPRSPWRFGLPPDHRAHPQLGNRSSPMLTTPDSRSAWWVFGPQHLTVPLSRIAQEKNSPAVIAVAVPWAPRSTGPTEPGLGPSPIQFVFPSPTPAQPVASPAAHGAIPGDGAAVRHAGIDPTSRDKRTTSGRGRVGLSRLRPVPHDWSRTAPARRPRSQQRSSKGPKAWAKAALSAVVARSVLGGDLRSARWQSMSGSWDRPDRGATRGL